MTKKTRSAAEAVAEAKALQPKLAAAADALNAKIAQFEKALKSLNLGVVASVTIWTEPVEPEVEDLIFTKWGNDWRLVVAFSSAHTEARYELLQNTSREQRLKAVALFPDLVEALTEAAEKEIARVSKSSDSIDELIASMKSGAR